MTLQVPQQTNQNGAIHFDPQRIGRLKDPVIVLRKVNVNKLQRRETPEAKTAWELIGMGQVQLHLREDQLPWYEQGFIVNDNPRDEKVARDIARVTVGFALARTDTGEILKVYGPDGIKEAYADAAGVTLTIKPTIERLAPKSEEDEEALVQSFLEQHKNVVDEAPIAQTE